MFHEKKRKKKKAFPVFEMTSQQSRRLWANVVFFFSLACKRGQRNVLQSIFFIPLMFALLNAALRDPLQMEGDVWCGRFLAMTPQQGGSPPVPRSPRWPQHPGRPRSGLPYVSVNISPACCRCHAGVNARRDVAPSEEKPQPAWCRRSRHTRSATLNANWQEDLRWM